MNDPHEHDLYDEKLSNIYQQSRIEEPPMSLDSTILTQARKAVEKPMKRPFWGRIGWMMPLASAAVAMLTVSLFIQTEQDYPGVISPELMMDSSPMEERVIELKVDQKNLILPAKRKSRQASIPPASAPLQTSGMVSDVANEHPKRLSAAQSRSRVPVEVEVDLWLEKIRKLIRQGKIVEARESLELFRKEHPDFPLPKDMISALK